MGKHCAGLLAYSLRTSAQQSVENSHIYGITNDLPLSGYFFPRVGLFAEYSFPVEAELPAEKPLAADCVGAGRVLLEGEASLPAAGPGLFFARLDSELDESIGSEGSLAVSGRADPSLIDVSLAVFSASP